MRRAVSGFRTPSRATAVLAAAAILAIVGYPAAATAAGRGHAAGTGVLWGAAVFALATAGMTAWRLVSGEREHERLYGRPRGRLRARLPLRRRVPGLPREGVLTGEDEAAFAALQRGFRQREAR
jgi:hypothetical protein